MAGERAGVHARDRGDAVRPQQRCQLARIVQHCSRRVGHDQAPEPRPLGLVVGHQASVVADERVGHDHDLARVGRVGGDLLVPGLGRVDHEVPTRGHGCTEGDALEDGAVLQREQRRTGVTDTRIDDRVGAREREVAGRRWGDHSDPGGPRRASATGGHAHRLFLLPGLTGPVRRPHGTGLRMP